MRFTGAQRVMVVWSSLTALALITATCSGQEVEKPYDGIQAGLDAFRRGEEQRQANFNQQLYMNDQMKIWAGLPTSGVGSPRGVTTYYGASQYGSPYAAPLQPGMSLSYAYGFGGRAILDRTGQPITVFEPWPYVPGDIYGYRYYTPTRQSIGQRQVQIGPNTWESHPVYDPPLTPYQPLPPVDSPLLDRTPYASPEAAERAALPSTPPPTTTPPPADAAALDPELPPSPPAPGISPPAPSKPRGPRVLIALQRVALAPPVLACVALALPVFASTIVGLIEHWQSQCHTRKFVQHPRQAAPPP